jgi:hypothetical protein
MHYVLPQRQNKQDALLSVKNQKTPPTYITFLKDKRNDSTIFQAGLLVIKQDKNHYEHQIDGNDIALLQVRAETKYSLELSTLAKSQCILICHIL